MNLLEWTKHYIKFKDCIKKQIQSIEEKEDRIVVQEKKGEKIYCVSENIEDKLLTQKKCEGKKYLITLNKKQNVTFLAENWDLIKDEDVTIIFANTETNESWMIHPKTHSRISEDKSLKPGLIALYENITESK